MLTSSTRPENEFGGSFHSDRGSQILGNSFNTGGGDIYFDFNSSTSKTVESFARQEYRLPYTDNKPPVKICKLPDYSFSSYFTGRGDKL